MAFLRSADIMPVSQPLHLTVLAVVRCAKPEPDTGPPSALRKIAAKASLATVSQSCILPAHSIRRLTKLPTNKTA